MKRIICGLLIFCLLLPALAFAAPSQKLQAIYDSVDTLNVEELVALQDYCCGANSMSRRARFVSHLKICRICKKPPVLCNERLSHLCGFYAVSGFTLSIISTFASAR